MHKEYKTKFYYNSTDPKFFGTTIASSISLNITSFSVIGQTPITQVFEIGKEGSGIAKVEGSTEISGQIRLRIDSPNEGSLSLDTIPFNISLHAYDPINRIPYCAKVLGVHISKVNPSCLSKTQHVEFVAQNIVKWHRTSTKKIFSITVETDCLGNNEVDYVNKEYIQNKLNEGICYTDEIFKVKEIKENL